MDDTLREKMEALKKQWPSSALHDPDLRRAYFDGVENCIALLYEHCWIPGVRIGKYYIREISDTDRLWIGVENSDGEGGSFPVTEVEKIIGEYYDKEF